MDEAKKADFRLTALALTNHLQQQIGFADQFRALVEHTIFDIMKRVHFEAIDISELK